MVRLTLALLLLLSAASAWAGPDLKADRAARAQALETIDCAGRAELLVALAHGVDDDAIQPALDALGARVAERFDDTGLLLVEGDAGSLQWLAASGQVASVHLVRTALDREAAVLRRLAARDGTVRVIVTTLPGQTDYALTALGDAGAETLSRMETTPQATLELDGTALDRLLALPMVCAVAEDRLAFGN